MVKARLLSTKIGPEESVTADYKVWAKQKCLDVLQEEELDRTFADAQNAI